MNSAKFSESFSEVSTADNNPSFSSNNNLSFSKSFNLNSSTSNSSSTSNTSSFSSSVFGVPSPSLTIPKSTNISKFDHYLNQLEPERQPTINHTNPYIQAFAPPLPIIKFQNFENEKNKLKTCTNEEIRSYPNKISNLYNTDKKVPLHNPLRSRRIAKYYIERCQKEASLRQSELYNKSISSLSTDNSNNNASSNASVASTGSGGSLPNSARIDLINNSVLQDYLVYESYLYTENQSERTARQAKIKKDLERISLQFQSSINDGSKSARGRASTNSSSNNSNNLFFCLTFDGEFESGNLEKVTRVVGRETLMGHRLNPPSSTNSNSSPYTCPLDFECPAPVDHEYDLILRNDLYTYGNIQWYYFSATCPKEVNGQPVTFPIKVRFNIINMQKKDSLYNYGMRPVTYSELNNKNKDDNNQTSTKPEDWVHSCYDIAYYKNSLMNITIKEVKNEKKKKSLIRHQYSLSFSYTFTSPDTVYFAHSFPYTYTDLQLYLEELDNKESISSIFSHRILCETLAGNKLHALTITERASEVKYSRIKSSIILTGRIHPGETNSSYMLHGLINFLLSDAKEAKELRQLYIFTIIPMLNPDGVIHGNYRCSLAGTDLNRRYSDTHRILHPTIYALKELLINIRKQRTITLYLDFHGHSRAKNIFVYGCDPMMIYPERYSRWLSENLNYKDVELRRVHSRVLPKIMSIISKRCNCICQCQVLYNSIKNESKDDINCSKCCTCYSSGYFSFTDCSFTIGKSKFSTGRAFFWRQLGIWNSYTLEASFCGNGDNREVYLLKKYHEKLNTYSLPSSTNISGNSTPTSDKKTDFLSSLSTNDISLPSIVGVNNNHNNSNNSILSNASTVTSNSSFKAETEDTFKHLYFENDEEIEKVSSSIMDQRLFLILSQYRTQYHYRKFDLMEFGRHVGLSLHANSNLSKSNYVHDLEEMSKKEDKIDKENKNNNDESEDKDFEDELINCIHNLSNQNFSPTLSTEEQDEEEDDEDDDDDIEAEEEDERLERDDTIYEKLRTRASNNRPSTASLIRSTSQNVPTSPFTPTPPSKDNFSPSKSLKEPKSPAKTKKTKKLKEKSKSHSDLSQFFDFYLSNSLTNSDSPTSNSPASNRYLISNEIELMKLNPLYQHNFHLKFSKIFELSDNNLNTIILNPSLYSMDTLKNLFLKYPSEFLLDSDSINVSLRIKCEFALRYLLSSSMYPYGAGGTVSSGGTDFDGFYDKVEKFLNNSSSISLASKNLSLYSESENDLRFKFSSFPHLYQQAKQRYQEKQKQLLKETQSISVNSSESSSIIVANTLSLLPEPQLYLSDPDEGSDSCPSIDNGLAPTLKKMINKMGSGQRIDSKKVSLCLRSALQKKKKKDQDLKAKYNKKLIKQAYEAQQKLQLDQESMPPKSGKTLNKLTICRQNQQQRRSSTFISPQSRGSISASLKNIQSSSEKVSVPLQIKLISFNNLDLNNSSNNTFSSSNNNSLTSLSNSVNLSNNYIKKSNIAPTSVQTSYNNIYFSDDLPSNQSNFSSSSSQSNYTPESYIGIVQGNYLSLPPQLKLPNSLNHNLESSISPYDSSSLPFNTTLQNTRSILTRENNQPQENTSTSYLPSLKKF